MIPLFVTTSVSSVLRSWPISFGSVTRLLWLASKVLRQGRQHSSWGSSRRRLLRSLRTPRLFKFPRDVGRERRQLAETLSSHRRDSAAMLCGSSERWFILRSSDVRAGWSAKSEGGSCCRTLQLTESVSSPVKMQRLGKCLAEILKRQCPSTMTMYKIKYRECF